MTWLYNQLKIRVVLLFLALVFCTIGMVHPDYVCQLVGQSALDNFRQRGLI